MDLITKAIQDIKFSIPREILKLAYQDNRIGQYTPTPTSLEDAIRNKTIVPRVVVDMDIVGGQTIIIDISRLMPKIIDDNNFIFEIPSDYTDHRTIISVLAVNYFRSENIPGNKFNAAPGVSPMIGSELSSSAQRAMNSRGSIPMVSTAECIVVGHNTIMIRNHLRSAAMTQIRCRVENDQNLSNLPIVVAPIFSKLCKFAVKAYIHNELIVKLDRGYIDRGHEIGTIKSIIESYADAEENYCTCRDEEWGAVATMCDTNVYTDLIKMMICPSI